MSTLQSIAVLLCVGVAVGNISGLLTIVPLTLGCALRWNQNIHIEESPFLCNRRNRVFTILVPPSALLYAHCIGDGSWTAIGLCAAVILSWALLHKATYSLTLKIAGEGVVNKAVANTHRNFFILCFALTLLSTGALSLLGVAQEVLRSIISKEVVVIYAIMLVRTYQIFASTCGKSSSFLYLCSLEFVPAAVALVPIFAI